MLKARLSALGPASAAALARDLRVPENEVMAALRVEAQGVVLRGSFTGGEIEWGDRRLLARIHRYTVDRLRREIEPLSGALDAPASEAPHIAPAARGPKALTSASPHPSSSSISG